MKSARVFGLAICLGCVLVIHTLASPVFSSELAEAKTVAPIEVRKVFDNGKHNAFTAMTRFQGNLYLAFRAGASHNSTEADLLVLRSTDGQKWQEVHRLDAYPDDRDPQFLIVGKKLILYDPAIKAGKLVSFATYTTDGKTWSKPQPVYEPNYIFWKPTSYKGKYYAAAHKRDNTSGGKGRDVHLIVSDDGFNWKKISTIRKGNWESETTLFFHPDGKITAFLRQKYGSPRCQFLEAEAPYTRWTARKPNIDHLSGHSVQTIQGVTYLASRVFDKGKPGCVIYTFDGKDLHPYARLPAGGDCSYAEMVPAGAAGASANMLVSYYSSHEGHASIYLAVVPLKK